MHPLPVGISEVAALRAKIFGMSRDASLLVKVRDRIGRSPIPRRQL